jgi:hypothetical protein
MIGLPLFHALERKRVIWILLRLFVHIDHHQWQHHLLEADLIYRAQAPNKMRRRIHVRPPLSDMSKNFRKKAFSDRAATFLIPINGLALFIRKSVPMRDAGAKGVSEIDKSFLRQDFLDFQKRRLGRHHIRSRRKTCRQAKQAKEPKLRHRHFALLNDRSTRSQQVRISPALLRLPFRAPVVGLRVRCYQQGRN